MGPKQVSACGANGRGQASGPSQSGKGMGAHSRGELWVWGQPRLRVTRSCSSHPSLTPSDLSPCLPEDSPSRRLTAHHLRPPQTLQSSGPSCRVVHWAFPGLPLWEVGPPMLLNSPSTHVPRREPVVRRGPEEKDHRPLLHAGALSAQVASLDLCDSFARGAELVAMLQRTTLRLKERCCLRLSILKPRRG